MANVKDHEYRLLDEIGQDSLVTQAALSKRLGIAVGSVNWYVKRLIQRGWIKVSHLDRTRLKYDLTPQGMTVFTQRAVLYVADSLRFYGEIRARAQEVVSGLQVQGIRRVHLDGDGPMMDILRLTCIEKGLILQDAPRVVVLRTSGDHFIITTTDATATSGHGAPENG